MIEARRVPTVQPQSRTGARARLQPFTGLDSCGVCVGLTCVGVNQCACEGGGQRGHLPRAFFFAPR